MLTIQEVEIAKARATIASDKRAEALWNGLVERTGRYVTFDGLKAPQDTNEWWHTVWDKLAAAAFVQRVKPSERLGRWVRSRVLEIVDKPIDEFIGPWFRARSNPPEGMLETSHVGLAVSMALILTPTLFDEKESRRILQALRDKCQEPCRRWLDNRFRERNALSNWFMILLDGFGTASILLEDEEAVAWTVKQYGFLTQLYNQDSYGESLQYWNYATIHLSHLHEMLIRYKPQLAGELDLLCYTRCIPWAVHSFLGMKPMTGWGEKPYPRSLNFGDSTVLFRPSGDVLMHIAARAKEQSPREAGLARWLFEQAYPGEELEPNDLGTFGIFPTHSYLTLLLMPGAAAPLDPRSAEEPLLAAFETGTVVMRDNWEKPKTVLGMQAGFIPLRVNSHNHEDQNSFILVHQGERFFADPGHCCYRLASQQASIITQAHNTWSFAPDGAPEQRIVQERVTGNVYRPAPSKCDRLLVKQLDEVAVIRADAAKLYGDPIRRAERTWVTLLPHIVLIIDRIEAEQPIQVCTHFVMNNRDGALEEETRMPACLEFRRGQAGVKLIHHAAEAAAPIQLKPSWGFVHDVYHPLPNQKGQGAEGSANIYTYVTTACKKEHVNVYAILMDDASLLGEWGIEEMGEGELGIHPVGLEIKLSPDDTLALTRNSTGQRYHITKHGLHRS
ncbi:hypothetical protein B2K_10890 [Paenibacillus mucilaginosus K02]|uniref:Heparinase II/III-like C-terminal domain-containing protein n=2 Tax=Paenibacillus mucilaginosus TaxID=61624 RepID=I0BFS3_9BACL|nr:hypothetical protein B2K_10890 [Paenibacillus mucilaginosus K02]